jgi:hypothetical protein
MTTSRVDQLTAVLECYGELAVGGMDFRSVAMALCKVLPQTAIPGLEPVTCLEAACERTIARMAQPNPPRGLAVLTYLKVVFAAFANGSQRITANDMLSRIGEREELEAMRKCHREAADARAKAAVAPRTSPAAAAAALARLGAKPTVGDWQVSGKESVRPVLQPRKPATDTETRDYSIAGALPFSSPLEGPADASGGIKATPSRPDAKDVS